MNFKEWLLAEELKSANAPNISLTPKAKPIDVESNLRILKNNQRIAALGRHFNNPKNNGKEPYINSPLGKWLYSKRRAFRDSENMQKNPNYPRTTNSKWYDTDLQVAKNAGLPDDWHTNTEKYKPEYKLLQDFKKINDENIKELGKHFKNPKNKGKEPRMNSPLGLWLYNKRKAFLDHENMQKNPNYPRTTRSKWYDTDLQVAKNAGLPDDWHTNTEKYKPENKQLQDFKKNNDQNIKELGVYFKNPKNKGKEPYRNTPLGQWLFNKRMAFLDHENMQKNPNYPRTTSHKWYDTDLQVAKNAGLPDDWHTNTEKYKPENKQLQDFKKNNDQNIKELGVYYKKFGEPSISSDEGKFLYGKRRAYQDFINNTKTTGTKWYDTDEQVGIDAGLPKGWHLPVEKQKVSQGAKFVRNILDYLNIEHIAEFRDRFCLGKTGRCLPFDYSFEHNDQEYFIEYHGQQHYYPSNFGSNKNEQEYAKLALENFENIQHRDKLKYNYCKQNKFPLLVIPYWTPFSDIKDIIKDFLKHDFDEENFDEEIFDMFANPEVPEFPENLKEKHKQIYKKYYDMSINKT